jgi:hypothetical protein
MYVVRRDRTPYDDHIPGLADLTNQVARTLSNMPPQYPFIGIWCTRSRDTSGRKTACALCLYSAIPPLSKAWNGLLEADRLKGGGIKPGGRS